MTEITDTHRRANLRGRESVARWRIESGVWAGRLYTIIYAVATILPLLRREGPDWRGAFVLALLAGALLFATERLRRGSRLAACALLGLFVAGRLGAWFVGGQPVWKGLLWTVILGGAFANAAWGAFALAAVRRDAALVPPAPPRPGDHLASVGTGERSKHPFLPASGVRSASAAGLARRSQLDQER